MESADEIGVRVESLIHQVDQLSDKAESLASSDTGERASPETEPKTLDHIHLVDDTGDEFQALPQTNNSRLISESDEQDDNGSNVVVKSAEESKLSKMSDVKVVMSDSGSVNPQSTQQSIQLDVSGIRVRSDPTNEPNKTTSTDVQIKSSNTSGSSSIPKNQTATSEPDSLTTKVNRVLRKNQTPPLSMSALDSIEVKSVSSTTSSKFAHESDRFQQSSLWRFVKQFIPEKEQEIVKHKMVSELSRSTDLSSMSSNQSNINRKPIGNQTGNASGKSVLSEQRFVDGIVYSPMGSHKSSTPDHSFISGWKYTKDSDFIHGNIRVAESESSDPKTQSKGQSDSSGLSHSADELSERVRKLLRQIDNSLDEKAISVDKDDPPVIPKLRGLDEVTGGHGEQADLSASQVTGTPRSIEDLTSDERFGSFMPNTSPHKQLKKPIIREEDEFNQTFESSLEEGEIREDTFDENVITEQIQDELRTSRLREELEMEQIEIKLQLDKENESQNTQSTSAMKSDDAIAPEFPQYAYGSRETSMEKMVQNLSASKMYYKTPKPAAVKEAWREVTPEPTPEVSMNRSKPAPVNKSVRVVEPKTAPPSNIASVIVHEDNTPQDSIRIVNDTQLSTASSTFDWYPRNMKEFKALPKDKKTEFLKKLKNASKRKRNESSSSASTISTASSAAPPPPAPVTEENLTQKIISAIDSNVRKTIQAELEKLKIVAPPPPDGNKENEPVRFRQPAPPPAIPTQSGRPQSKVSLHDIEDEINEYKSKERITSKVENEKKELQKNCAFMVSFGTQVEERNISLEIREQYKKSQEKSNVPLGKSCQATQTLKAPVKRSNAWYCPIFTDRKVPIDRNALDSTKRLAENAWQKASLQEAMLIHKQEFISKSRARVRHVKLRQEQRLIEQELENERQKLFGTYTERQRVAQIHPLADKHHLGERRPINLKTARKETSKRYNKLPEVVQARKHEKFNREKVENQIKAKCFNRKIQSKVLSKL